MDTFQAEEMDCRRSPATFHHNSSSDEDLRAFNTTKLFQILRTKRSEAEIIERLGACLKAGADIKARNGRGKTVLCVAKNKNYHTVAEFLLQQDGVSEENIPATPCIDIDEGFAAPPLTKCIVDADLKLSCPDYIDLLKTVTKDNDSINEKLSLDPYPSDRTLALLALKVYSDNPNDETRPELPGGWELLTTACSPGRTNGYFGAAFWCRDLRQVVVAHRGTAITNTGALWTNVKSIIWNKETSRVCSAITFTAAIATALNIVKEEGVRFQLSITGHSLGGWLAQVTAFTVKYMQKDMSTFRKLINIKDGFHAHTVVFDSPGCRSMLSSMKDKYDLRYERSIFLRRLDISSYLSAPNRINCLNLHMGIIYRVVTDLSDISVLDEYTSGYTTKTHSMKKMLEALETPVIVEMLDWPLRSVLRGEEYNTFFKGASRINEFHQQTDRYEFKAVNRNFCSLRIFSEDELLLLDAWMILKKSKMNLTNLIKIKSLTVSELFDEFVIDKEKQTIACSSEESMKKLIRHTKALMRWLPAEVMAATKDQAALVPSAAEAMFRTESDNYLRSLERIRLDFRDTLELEVFLKSGSNILIVRTPDSAAEMTRLVNILQQINIKRDHMEETNYRYSFMDLNRIKRLESAVNIQGLFKSCFTEVHSFFIQCTDNCIKTCETILIEILNNLKNNSNNKLVFVESHETYFEDFAKTFFLSLEIDNILILKHAEEIKLNDLSEKSMETLFGRKVILFQGERFSLRELVGEYHHLTADQLNNVNTLIGPQIFKNLLTTDNYAIEMEDALLSNDDLKVHSTVNKEVSVARVAQALQEHSGSTLVVISGISREELGIDPWRKLAHALGEERISTTTEDGELIFKKMCQEEPSATVYWLTASAGLVHCKSIYETGFYMKRRFHKIIFNLKKFMPQAHKYRESDIFVFLNVGDKQSLMSHTTISEEHKNIFLNTEHVRMAATTEEAEDIIKGNSGRAVHILEREANLILWQRSRGSLEGLRPYVSTDIGESEDERELRNTCKKVVIIADEPGMGKSTSLTSLSRLLRSSAWVIRVDLKDFQIPNFHNLPSELSLNSVCELILRDADSWLRRLLQYCLDKEHKNSRGVYIFFDGFDEIKRDSSTEYSAEDQVLKLLKYLNNETTARVWVTTRVYRRQILENALLAVAMRFERISEPHQQEYLVKFWRPHLLLELVQYKDAENEKVEKCAGYVFQNAKQVLGDDVQNFMGIPLQMRMLAEVSMQRVKDYVESESDIRYIFDIKSVFDLYQQFVRLKYDIYFSDKTGLNTGMSQHFKKSSVEQLTESHRLLALRTLFPEFAKEHFNDPEAGWGAELCRVGLVQAGGGLGENVEFIHRTLAEYFCADLAVYWLREKGRYHGHAPVMELLLSEILLRDSYKVIRIFVNYLVMLQPLSEDMHKFGALIICKLWLEKYNFLFNKDHQTAFHTAVQERNTGIIDILAGGLKSELAQKGLIPFIAAHDGNRRTALGLAAKGIVQEFIEIMKKLIQSVKTCPHEVILELLLATYVRYTDVLNEEIKLLSEYVEGEAACPSINKAFTRTRIIIHKYIPRLHRALEGSRSVNYLSFFFGRSSRSKTGEVEKLYGEMENDIEKRYMRLAPDGGEVRGGTVLHRVARAGNNEDLNETQIIIILCNNNNIPEVGRSYDKDGWTPLHRAAAAGQLDIVEQLIKRGVYIDSLTMRDETALFSAASAGRLPVVQYLIENGSNITIVNRDGETALNIATKREHQRVMEFLKRKLSPQT